MSDQHSVPRPRRRFAPLLIVAGLASAVVLSLSMTNTLSAFTAAITNSNDTAASGTVVLQEINTATGNTTCNSTDTTPANTAGVNTNTFNCSTINKYGGLTKMVPGSSVTTNLTFGNTGTAPAATFTLAANACTQSTNGALNGNATDFCAKLNVLVASGGTTIYNGTAAAFSGATTPTPFTLPLPAPGATIPITITVTLATTAGNTYQGLAASQPLVWSLST